MKGSEGEKKILSLKKNQKETISSNHPSKEKTKNRKKRKRKRRNQFIFMSFLFCKKIKNQTFMALKISQKITMIIGFNFSMKIFNRPI